MSNEGNGNGAEHFAGRPIAIYYEQQHWFKPLFEQLDKRGVPWVRVDARNHQYDLAGGEQEYSLLRRGSDVERREHRPFTNTRQHHDAEESDGESDRQHPAGHERPGTAQERRR